MVVNVVSLYKNDLEFKEVEVCLDCQTDCGCFACSCCICYDEG